MSGKITDNIGRSSGLVKAAAGGGKVLQAVQATNTTTGSTTTSSFQPLPDDWGVAITCAATSSKVLVIGTIMMGGTDNFILRVVRDSTAIGVGVASSSRPAASVNTRKEDGNTCSTIPFTFLDSPSSTSELTYKWQWNAYDGVIWNNRTHSDLDDARGARGMTSLQVIEIGA